MAIVRKSASATYFAPVTVSHLTEDGQLVELKFDAQFKRRKQTDVNDFYEEQRKKGEIKHKTVVDDNLVGWRGVINVDKSDVHFSLEEFYALCEEYPGTLAATAESWHSSNNPKAAAHLAAKNL